MPFHIPLLNLLIMASPFVIGIVTYWICCKLGAYAEAEHRAHTVREEAPRTYFYPSRELDGNGS
jgi:hypothetical protein